MYIYPHEVYHIQITLSAAKYGVEHLCRAQQELNTNRDLYIAYEPLCGTTYSDVGLHRAI